MMVLAGYHLIIKLYLITRVQHHQLLLLFPETIFVRLKTADVLLAGTDGDVYIGLGGREFQIDSKDEDINDFEKGDHRI